MSYDETKPVQNGLLISADHRANWLALRQNLFSANWLQDPLFECWNLGDSAAPGTWRLSGTGATIARETAAADVFLGAMAPRVTFGSATAILAQNILDTLSYDDDFDGKTVTAFVAVKPSQVGNAILRINDGADFTDSAASTGSGAFETLEVEHEINAAADRLEIQLRISGGNGIWDAAVFLWGDVKPNRFVYPVTIRSTIPHSRRGELFVGKVDEFVSQRAYIVEDVQLRAVTPPVGADVIVDVNQGDGTAFTSMFSGGGRPTILAGAKDGGAQPDGVYQRRCFIPHFGTVLGTTGKLLGSDIDQVGVATTEGADLNIYIRVKGWARPQELIANVPTLIN